MDFKTLALAITAVAMLTAVYLTYDIVQPETGVVFQEIPRFESYDAMLQAFKDAQEQGRNYGIMEDFALGTPMAAVTKGSAESGSAGVDFSATNIQVEGVDEADIVKTDGKYIYALSRNKLVITLAYPIDEAKVVSSTEFGEMNPMEMFVSGNKLLVFGNISWVYTEDKKEGLEISRVIAPNESYYPYYGGATVAQLFDISDRENPKLEKELEFQGNYNTSRLIGNNAYFVVTNWAYYRELGKGNIIPLMAEDGEVEKVAEVTEIGYVMPMPAEGFVTIVSLNLDSKETQKETIVGSVQNVYASQDSIYLAGTVWYFPEIPIVEDAIRPIVGDTETTVVNKFGLKDGEIGFVGQGQVPGHVLNQFSIDEFEGNFRIATTIGWNGSNSVYVLDSEMNTVGKLEDLAPGESIYSARFMGKKAYLVTFKKVDPLFVLDMANPKNPKVLGKLKIPGYSDYLHPFDETHIIGVGKETIEAAKGDFAWYQGLKMAIFDVSDVSNPKEMHKVVIGDRGTDSYALRDHKAFLFDKEKELLVLPILLAEIPEEQKRPLEGNQQWPSYGEPVFQGAFVFKVSLGEGFVERGRITHITPEDELKRGYYYGSEYSVKRSLFIENVLYTLSERMLKANALDTLEGLKEFSLQ